MDIQAEIGRIQELSDDELTALREGILDSAKTAKESIDAGMNSESVQALTSLAEAANAVKEEDARRKAEATELTAQAEAATAAIEELASKPEKDDEVEDDVVVEELPVEDEEIIAPEPAPADEDEIPADENVDEDKDKKKEEETAVEDSEEDTVEDLDPEKEDEEAAVEVNEPDVTETSVEVASEATEEVAATAKEADEEEPTEEDPADEDKEKEASVTEEVAAVEEVQENKETEVDASVDITRQENNAPEPAVVAAALPTIVAAGNTSAAHMGDTLPNIRALANALTDTRKHVRNTGMSHGERDYVGSLVLPEMEDRHLYASNVDENSRKISDYVDATINTNSVTASGGLYGPIADYDDVFEFEANTKRPVKEALPGFRADQGGIRYYSPTVLKDLEGAASIWTIEDDIAALDPSNNLEKPSLRVEAGQPVEVVVDAVPLSLTFGNIGNKFRPELAERHIRIGMQLHARVAEQHLITRIATMSTWAKTTSKLGFARDLFVAVETAAAGYRNRNRLEDDTALRVIMPSWAKNAIRADLAMQLPGDQTFSVGDNDIERWFTDRNIKVTFAFDSESTQYFGTQADTAGTGKLTTKDATTRIETINEAAKVAGNLTAFPSTLTWYIFLDGTFLFLDGGTLDLGVVRDSTLNKVNDYQMFLETFEGVAKVGPESIRVSTPVKITGASSGTVDVA